MSDRPRLALGTRPEELTDDVAWLTTVMVNVFLVGERGAGDREWVLVDAGLVGGASRIRRAARERFGPNSRPAAIILTHAHFDHIGSVRELAEEWDVPVYAHTLELPYVTGRSSYPPPDPTVGGGLVARMSWLYPTGPIDLGERMRPLPDDGTVPGMPGWRWVFTPGHSPGHVSLFREHDRLLIAGDAFVTQKQESLVGALTMRPELRGPPKYFTCDWDAAEASVRKLAALKPLIAATGHGIPMAGPHFERELESLAAHFREIDVPRRGRYVRSPAIADENGVEYVPPPVPDPWPKVAAGVAIGAAVVFLLFRRGWSRRSTHFAS
ncbi:MAG: yflN 1 [Phycisphaerales bacterium]|nr:yflN 1 [Phycisphaerales bacterium]